MNEEKKAPEAEEDVNPVSMPEDKSVHMIPVNESNGTGMKTPETEEQFMEAPAAVHEETHEEEDLDVHEDYSDLPAEELVALLEKYVDETEVPRFKVRIAAIRDQINHMFQAEHEEALTRFLEDGGNRDDYKPAQNPLEERFSKALRKFHRKRAEYQEKIEKQRHESFEIKNDILKQLKDLIQNEENMTRAFDKFHELQAKWRSTGPVPPSNVKDLQMTYKFYIDKFYDFIKINRELQDLDHRKNLEAKLQLCEQAEELLLEPSLNTAFRKLHALQDKWRETGPVPRDKKNEIWDRFKAACDKIFENRKQYLAESSEKRKQNLEAKTSLCEQVEAITPDEKWKHRDWQEASKKIMELQADWKRIGPADKKANDEIWDRFKKACDSLYKAKNEFYHKRKQEFSANLQLKTELCIQAEALQDNHDWKSTTAELIRLQQEWKKTGPVGEKQSDKIWKRFRTACDNFFNNKTKHFSGLDKEHESNLARKLELLNEIEAYQPGENASEGIDKLKSWQRLWSEIGLVPIGKKDEIQKRYRTVIDSLYDKLKVSNTDRQSNRYQGRQEHSRTNDRHGKMDDERRHLMHKINELKNDVQIWENNIGFFARSKNADKLKSEFEEKINKAKEEINELKSKLEMAK